MRHTPNKITAAEVPGIRHRLGNGITTRLMEADRYGVAPETIAKIARFQTFRNVGRLPPGESMATKETMTETQTDDAQAIFRRLQAKGLVHIVPAADTLVRELRQTQTEATDSPINPMEE